MVDLTRVAPLATQFPLGGIPCANESIYPDGSWTTVYAENTQKRYIALRAVTSIRLVYIAAGGLNDTVATQPMSVRAGIWSSLSASPVPATFNGLKTGRCEPGALLISDPISVKLTAGQQFWVKTWAGGPNLMFCGTINATQVAWSEGCDAAFNTATTDKTVSGTIGTNNVSHLSPLAIVGDGIMASGSKFVGHFGDSIGNGLGDTASISDYGRGFLRRAMANSISYVNLCVSGDLIANSHNVRLPIFRGCSSVVSNMGINDVVGGATASTIETNIINKAIAISGLGPRVYWTTITPKTSSTDTWATAANQTPFANDSVRVAVNTWIRAGFPVNSGTLAPVAVGTPGALLAGQAGHPVSGYFEVANTIECDATGALVQDGGRWAVGSVYTTDAQGLHPNSTGAAAMSAAINTAVL